jgi:hypothetical protein
VEGRAHDPADRGAAPYLKLHSDDPRVIHIAYTEGNPGSFVNNIRYLRFHDGAFHRADSSRVARSPTCR